MMLPVDDFTVGNTITVAVALYKRNFRKFFRLSLAAHLWLLVPIYGWGKYLAIAAWVSKLSFDELTGNVNNPDKKQYFSLYSLLIFLITGLISIIIPLILGYLLTTVIFLVVGAVKEIITLIFSLPAYDLFDTSNTVYPLVAVLIFTLFVLFSVWFYTKMFVSDLILINSKKQHLLYLINRSRRIVTQNRIKTFKIILLSSIVSTDLLSTNENAVISICLILGLLGAHGILLPFWQAVKAVAFYQLTDLDRRYNLR